MRKPKLALGSALVLSLLLAACTGANSDEVLTGAEPRDEPPGTGIQIGNPNEINGTLMDGGYRVLPPRAVAPPADAIFYEIPRNVTLEWTAIVVDESGTEYEVEVDACDTSVVHPAVGCSDWTEEIRTTTALTTHTFEFSGAGSGRWRVRAVRGDEATRFSEYLYFEFVR